ncbi:hypothetical protein A3758_07570 [Oleiphilus sp. HI0118]|nr:hypothetical protein A3758_07570 [Oleiphilus sp. HI0118]
MRWFFFSAISLFIVISLFPLSVTFTYSFYDIQRLSQITLLVTSGLIVGLAMLFNVRWFVQSAQFLVARRFLGLMCAISSIFFAGLASCYFSEEPANALMYTLHFFMLTIFLFSALSCLTDGMVKQLLAFFVVIHCALVSYCMLNTVFAVISGDALDASLIYYGFENIRFFNQVQVLVLPLLLFYTLNARFGRIASLFLFFNLFLMLLGGGLGITLSWLAVLVLGMLLKGSSRIYVKGLLLTALAYSVFYCLSFYIASLQEGDMAVMDLSSGGRVELWSNSLSQFGVINLFLGVGPSIFSASAGGSQIFSHPHNALIELLVEWGGWVAAIVCFLIFRTIMSFVYQARKDLLDISVLAIGLAWLAGLLYSFVSGVLVMPVPQTLFFLLFGLLLKYLFFQRNELEDKLALSSGAIEANFFRVLGLVICGVVIVYLVLTMTSLERLDRFEPAFQGPRFWLNGLRYL